MNFVLKNLGDFFLELKTKYKNIIVFNSLLKTELGLGTFASNHEDSYFDFANSINAMTKSVDAFVLRGKTPIIVSKASDLMYKSFGDIKNEIAYNNLNVKIFSFFPGFDRANYGSDCAVLDDVMLMRSIPNMRVFVPSHIMEFKKMVSMAMESFGPVYIRISEDLMDEGNLFSMGEIATYVDGKDILVYTMGSILADVLEVRKRFEAQFKTIKIVNVPVLKDLKDLDFLSFAKGFENIFSVEEHGIFGGLGDFLCEKIPSINKISVPDLFVDSASKIDLKKKYLLDCDGIYKQMNDFLKR